MKLNHLINLSITILLSMQIGCSKGQDPESDTNDSTKVEQNKIDYKKYYFKALDCMSGAVYYDRLSIANPNQYDPRHPEYRLGADLYLLDDNSFQLDLLTIQVLSEDSTVSSYRILGTNTYKGKITILSEFLNLEGIGSLNEVQGEQGKDLILTMSAPTPYQNMRLKLLRTTTNLVPGYLQKTCH